MTSKQTKEEKAVVNFTRWVGRQLKKASLPTVSILLNEAKKRGLGEKKARTVLGSFKSLQLFAVPSRIDRKKRYHRGNAFPSLGNVQVDFASFHPDWSKHNDGRVGFILGVDQLSLRLTVLSTKSKSTEDWLKMVEEIVQRHPFLSKVITDRDAAVTNDRFRNHIRDKYNVSWEILTNRNKAYLAELMIRHVKRLLSVYMNANNTRRWVDFIEPLVNRHNSTTIPGTQYTPNKVDWRNYEEFTRELTKDPNFFSSLNVAMFKHTPPEALKLFKFNPGDVVRVDRRAHPDRAERRKQFDKPSVIGTYGANIYIVLERGFFYVSRARGYLRIYLLFDPRTEKRVPGSFYERDLALVSTSEV